MSRKWTYEIGCGYESILRDGVMVNKEQAVRALKNYESRITELEAEVTKCHELQDSYCDRIAELEGLVDKLIEVGDELADDREYQDDLADLWHDVTRGLKEREE